MLRVDPRGETVWVQTAAGGTNDVLDADNLAVRDSRNLGNVPVTTAWTPDGRHAYVTHFRDDFIAVMDAKSYDEVKRIGVGQGVANVAFRPDGRFAYATMPGEKQGRGHRHRHHGGGEDASRRRPAVRPDRDAAPGRARDLTAAVGRRGGAHKDRSGSGPAGDDTW